MADNPAARARAARAQLERTYPQLCAALAANARALADAGAPLELIAEHARLAGDMRDVHAQPAPDVFSIRYAGDYVRLNASQALELAHELRPASEFRRRILERATRPELLALVPESLGLALLRARDTSSVPAGEVR